MRTPSNSLSAETLLSREAAAQALTDVGYITSPSTLATKATRGNGPGYRIFGKRAIYRWGDLVAWAEQQTAPLRHSTSEIKNDLTSEVAT
jgi:hypothetical protein